MDRREFIGTLAGGLLAVPLAAEAQPVGKVYRIGVLSPTAAPFLLQPFVAAMQHRGWVESRDFTLDLRVTEGISERAEALASELVRLKVDLVLTITTPLALEARRASTTIPVVMMTSGYPVEAGVATSLARPGGNVTGSSVYAGGELWGKYLELLKSVLPRITRLAVLWDWVPPNIVSAEVRHSIAEFRRAAGALGLELRFQEIRTAEDLDRVLSGLGSEPVDALFATRGQYMFSHGIRPVSSSSRLPENPDDDGLPRRAFQCGIPDDLLAESGSACPKSRRLRRSHSPRREAPVTCRSSGQPSSI